MQVAVPWVAQSCSLCCYVCPVVRADAASDHGWPFVSDWQTRLVLSAGCKLLNILRGNRDSFSA